MANLLLLKRRIRAASNVSKTTKAMQMIAASKLKRAQDSTLSQRPYVEKLTSISQNISTKLTNKNIHNYLVKPEKNNSTLLTVLSPDKGLCGAMVTNLTKEIINYNTLNSETFYIAVGKKAENAIVNLKLNLIASFKFGVTLPSFDTVLPIVNIVDDYFTNKKVGSVKVLSTRFISVFSQAPKITNILPIEFQKEASVSKTPFTLFEPNPEEILPFLLKHFLEMTIFYQLIENFASEQAARMVAMQNATENANEIIESLQLLYNKNRQEKITNEILDIGGTSFSNL